MSPESGLIDPVVVRKRNLLRVFYAFSAASAISFAGAQYVRTVCMDPWSFPSPPRFSPFGFWFGSFA